MKLEQKDIFDILKDVQAGNKFKVYIASAAVDDDDVVFSSFYEEKNSSDLFYTDDNGKIRFVWMTVITSKIENYLNRNYKYNEYDFYKTVKELRDKITRPVTIDEFMRAWNIVDTWAKSVGAPVTFWETIEDAEYYWTKHFGATAYNETLKKKAKDVRKDIDNQFEKLIDSIDKYYWLCKKANIDAEDIDYKGYMVINKNKLVRQLFGQNNISKYTTKAGS